MSAAVGSGYRAELPTTSGSVWRMPSLRNNGGFRRGPKMLPARPLLASTSHPPTPASSSSASPPLSSPCTFSSRKIVNPDAPIPIAPGPPPLPASSSRSPSVLVPTRSPILSPAPASLPSGEKGEKPQKKKKSKEQRDLPTKEEETDAVACVAKRKKKKIANIPVPYRKKPPASRSRCSRCPPGRRTCAAILLLLFFVGVLVWWWWKLRPTLPPVALPVSSFNTTNPSRWSSAMEWVGEMRSWPLPLPFRSSNDDTTTPTIPTKKTSPWELRQQQQQLKQQLPDVEPDPPNEETPLLLQPLVVEEVQIPLPPTHPLPKPALPSLISFEYDALSVTLEYDARRFRFVGEGMLILARFLVGLLLSAFVALLFHRRQLHTVSHVVPCMCLELEQACTTIAKIAGLHQVCVVDDDRRSCRTDLVRLVLGLLVELPATPHTPLSPSPPQMCLTLHVDCGTSLTLHVDCGKSGRSARLSWGPTTMPFLQLRTTSASLVVFGVQVAQWVVSKVRSLGVVVVLESPSERDWNALRSWTEHALLPALQNCSIVANASLSLVVSDTTVFVDETTHKTVCRTAPEMTSYLRQHNLAIDK